MAIATGSQKRNITLKTSHLPELVDPFDGNIISADEVKRGKPHPDVFLAAAARLGRDLGEGDHNEVEEVRQLERRKGLVFEDAVRGRLSES